MPYLGITCVDNRDPPAGLPLIFIKAARACLGPAALIQFRRGELRVTPLRAVAISDLPPITSARPAVDPPQTDSSLRREANDDRQQFGRRPAD